MKKYESPAAKVVLLTLTDVIAASAEAPSEQLQNAGTLSLDDVHVFFWE